MACCFTPQEPPEFCSGQVLWWCCPDVQRFLNGNQANTSNSVLYGGARESYDVRTCSRLSQVVGSPEEGMSLPSQDSASSNTVFSDAPAHAKICDLPRPGLTTSLEHGHAKPSHFNPTATTPSLRSTNAPSGEPTQAHSARGPNRQASSDQEAVAFSSYIALLV